MGSFLGGNRRWVSEEAGQTHHMAVVGVADAESAEDHVGMTWDVVECCRAVDGRCFSACCDIVWFAVAGDVGVEGGCYDTGCHGDHRPHSPTAALLMKMNLPPCPATL